MQQRVDGSAAEELEQWRRSSGPPWSGLCGADGDIDALCLAFAEAMPSEAATSIVVHRLVERHVLVPAGPHGSKRQSVEVMELVEVARGWPIVHTDPRSPSSPATPVPVVALYVCTDARLRWAIESSELQAALDGGPVRGPTLRDGLLRGLAWDRPDAGPTGATAPTTLTALRELVPGRLARAMVHALAHYGLHDE